MKWWRHLYVQVLAAILLGGLLGVWNPTLAVQFKPLGDAFIKLIKLLIAPIIFTTVVGGIAGMSDTRRLGRVGLRALLYFEAVTTVALVIGLGVVNWLAPGAGVNADAASLDIKAVAGYAETAKKLSWVESLLGIIPNTFVGAFADGEPLQVLLLSLLFGVSLSRLGEHGRPVVTLLNEVARVVFGIVSMVTRLAPLAAFGAMAFTLGRYGVGALISLGKLMACVYATCVLFVGLVLGLIARFSGFSLWRLLGQIREELLIVLGTSSSESVLPRLMQRMQDLGCPRSIVGVVVPAGYSFNLDGTCIYLTMASVFIAQATHTPLSWSQQVGLLAVLLVTSKGAAGVTGSGFVTLAATLGTVGHIPVAGIALLLGVDRFMSEARALTNLIGNSVAALVITRWEGELDETKATPILLKSVPDRKG